MVNALLGTSVTQNKTMTFQWYCTKNTSVTDSEMGISALKTEQKILVQDKFKMKSIITRVDSFQSSIHVYRLHMSSFNLLIMVHVSIFWLNPPHVLIDADLTHYIFNYTLILIKLMKTPLWGRCRHKITDNVHTKCQDEKKDTHCLRFVKSRLKLITAKCKDL